MAQGTFTTERGTKVRTQSQRRFILVREWVERADGSVVSNIDKRSDKVSTLRAEIRRHPATNHPGAPVFSVLTIIDTVTGEVVR